MNPMKNNDKILSAREFMFSLPSVMIGVSILALPSDVTKHTLFSDGWISIVTSGTIFAFLAVMCVHIALHFPNQSFLNYASFLVTKPVAIGITLIFILTAIIISAHITRSFAYIAQLYLFERTPLAVIALTFLLVVVYAVSGTRVGLFRLNILFLPIIIFVFLFVGILNIKWVEPVNFLPLFQTGFQGYVQGLYTTFSAFGGFSIGLFYVFLVKQPHNLMKKTMIGVSIATGFYLFVFIISIGLFGNIVTSNLMYPTLDLAKRVDLPGAIFERIDAVVYTIWIIAIFNTVCLYVDASVLLLCNLIRKVKKEIVVFILSPIIFFIAILPREIYQFNKMMKLMGNFSMLFTLSVLLVLYVMIKVKWRRGDDEV